MRVGVPQEDAVATPVRVPLALEEGVEGTEREGLPEELAKGLGVPFAVRDKEGEAEAEGDMEAERQRLALPVPLAETRGVGEGQCVAPKECDMEGLADWEADAPAVRLGVE